uniref:Uncharacterized protein n=1 Tax=Panagrolaimus sp. ES5 TaxID=591445 RepID=A0AC34FB71_9BILA
MYVKYELQDLSNSIHESQEQQLGSDEQPEHLEAETIQKNVPLDETRDIQLNSITEGCQSDSDDETGEFGANPVACAPREERTISEGMWQ